MARIATPKILEWGTPPDPLSGWDFIVSELRKRPGKWANIGIVTKTTVNKRLPAHDGFEHRYVKADDGTSVWVRYLEDEDERLPE